MPKEKKQVDAIITSPPFAGTLYHLKGKPPEFWEELAKRTGRKAWLDPNCTTRKVQSAKDKGYSENPENIGNLPYGKKVDAIITSPPFGEEKSYQIYDGPRATNRKGDDSKTKTDNPNNIAKLPYECTSQNDAEYIPDEEEEWEFPNVTTKEQRRWYVSESISHPAKCNVLLVRKIIKEFTKPGDVVLDPMVGCGTTSVEAMLLGRDTIAVDLEKKFTDLTEANIRKVKETNAKSRFPLRLGETKVITGDSRRLSELLGGPRGPDAIISSPPYSESMTKRRKGYTVIPQLAGTRQMPLDTKDENIANLPHGESVDAIVTSPPFSNIAKSNEGGIPHGNIDTIVTSPPYESTIHKRQDYSKREERLTKKNIKFRPLGKSLQAHDGLSYGSNDSKNFGNFKGETYLSAMLKVYCEMFKVLKSGGVMVLVLKNFIRNYKVVDLVSDTIKLCESVGFRLVKRIKHKLRTKSFWRVNYKKSTWSRKFPDKAFPEDEFASVYQYETVLIFQKP